MSHITRMLGSTHNALFDHTYFWHKGFKANEQFIFSNKLQYIIANLFLNHYKKIM